MITLIILGALLLVGGVWYLAIKLVRIDPIDDDEQMPIIPEEPACYCMGRQH